MKKTLAVLFVAAAFLGCMKASDYGNVIPMDNGSKTIISLGSSEQDSRSKALKAADLSCKEAGLKNGYVTHSQKTKYIGMFASSEQQKTVSSVLGVASSVLGNKSASKSKEVYNSTSTSGTTTTTKSGSVGAGVSLGGLGDSISDNSYETTLSITCNI